MHCLLQARAAGEQLSLAAQLMLYRVWELFPISLSAPWKLTHLCHLGLQVDCEELVKQLELSTGGTSPLLLLLGTPCTGSGGAVFDGRKYNGKTILIHNQDLGEGLIHPQSFVSMTFFWAGSLCPKKQASKHFPLDYLVLSWGFLAFGL